MIYIVDDDREFAELVSRFVGEAAHNHEAAKIFTNAIEAINAINDEPPKLIFLDILLDGPDGFTLLNELRSYDDLAKVPIVIMSSLDFSKRDLNGYGVIGYLNKSEMKPEQIKWYVEKYV